MPKKTIFISLSVLLTIGLVAGAFQYIQTLKTELASAITVGTPNPGHTWAQMECNANSLCIDTANNRVGIGTNVPSNTLSVSPAQYSTGTASQSGTTVTGAGTAWTSSMIGSQFTFANGTSAGTITAFNSATSLTVSSSQTVASQAYAINYSGLNVTLGGKVGVGTINPAQNLEVNGNILASNGGDICNSSGKCLSSVFQTNVISGTNPACPTGQTAIMKAYNGTWYTASQVSTWSQVTCGQVMSSDGTALLVNSQHTSKNCTDAGGTVIGDGSRNSMCRFGQSTCPTGWLWYGGWSTTTGGTCGDYSKGCGCSLGGHAWSNNSDMSYCSGTPNYYPGYCSGPACYVYPTRTQIGCY